VHGLFESRFFTNQNYFKSIQKALISCSGTPKTNFILEYGNWVYALTFCQNKLHGAFLDGLHDHFNRDRLSNEAFFQPIKDNF